MPGRVLLALLALLCPAFPMQAGAAQFSGDYLLYVCGADKDGKELVKGGHAVCQAYIAGVIDYHNIIQSMGTAPSVAFCVPKGVSMNALQKIVFNYLYHHRQEHSSFVASPSVALALYAKFPCKKK